MLSLLGMTQRDLRVLGEGGGEQKQGVHNFNAIHL